nr:mediator of RNA polymerase II transcription subunit 12 [Ipomoea batatas]
MQRYHAGSCTSAVSNNTFGGASGRDTSRADATTIPTNFSRRSLQLTSYKLKCDKEPLNSRLGPPDYHPQTLNCPEETLNRDYVQSGYRETVDGLEEAREISLSQVPSFSKPVIIKCKEAIRKCHRTINESRAKKRKAGQVYGVPLEGSQLAKIGIFPDQRPCGEEPRKRWIEGLSQQHKRLRLLADHVPHGYRKRWLFEVLIRNNVPLLRATWFIKVTYLNQVRPVSSGLSSGVPDRTNFSRSEQWTKDVIDYMQCLLDEFVSRSSSHSSVNIRDRSPQMVYAGSIQIKNDPASTSADVGEPSLHFKWWYVVRILQWHHAEGLLFPSHVIDWVLNQLQDKEVLGLLQLLLPVIYGFIETVVLSQTYVRAMVRIAIHFIQETSPGGSDLVDNSRLAYTMSALVEMLRYLILAVPDTFVGLDCFPLPPCVANIVTDGGLFSKVSEDARKVKNGPLEVAGVLRDRVPEVRSESLSIDRVVSSIKKRADSLAKASRPDHPGQNAAKALHALDKSLVNGDLRIAYKILFENHCDGVVDESWITEVSSCLFSSLKHIGTMNLSFICSVFFICEWATCDFRDFRFSPPRGFKFTGRKDFSQIYIAIRILKLKMREMQSSSHFKNENIVKIENVVKDPSQQNNFCRSFGYGVGESFYNSKTGVGKSKDFLCLFDSPGPLHDVIVCWIDQHEVLNGEGLKRLQLLIAELIRAGLFYPQAYVRQLIVSGVMDVKVPLVDPAKRNRHCKILKQMSGPHVYDALLEAQIAEPRILSDLMNVYSSERRLVLHGMVDHYKSPSGASGSLMKHKQVLDSGGENASPPFVDPCRSVQSAPSAPSKNMHKFVEVEELKASVCVLLQFPSSLLTETGLHESLKNVKKHIVSSTNSTDITEGTPGCEECRKAKRQKLSEEKSSHVIYPQNPSDDEDSWWVGRGHKSVESFKVDPPPKPSKQPSRGRQKIVRKTQSLNQLASSARIESSQGASTSHVCDSRVSCPHHRSGLEGDPSKAGDGTKPQRFGDIVSIGKLLKKQRVVEKRTMTVWLIGVVKKLIEEAEKTLAKVGQYGRPFSTADDQGGIQWKLGEEELSMMLYLMDACNELVLAVRFLLWLLPKVHGAATATIHGSRSVLVIPRNADNNVCEVGESYVLSSIQRYENVLVAADLIPEALSAVMHRCAAIVASNGRVSTSPSLGYARYLLKKYGSVASVVEWQKNFKSTHDKRLTSELESGRLLDGEFGFPLGVPAGVEDLDDFFRQKISGVRVSRVALTMRDIVQRKVDEAFQIFYGKEKKHLGGVSIVRNPLSENWDDGYQIGQQVVMGLLDCMRQTGGAAQEGDPTLVSSAISAIVCNAGQVIAKIPDLASCNNHLNSLVTSDSLQIARRILRVHLTCLCLLKEALGERQSHVFEVALAIEASSAVAQNFTPGRAPRSQFQLSPESHDLTVKFGAAVSALVIGAILQGIVNLERMVSLFKLKEGLDVIHFIRSVRSNSNGNARSVGAFKGDSSVEVSVHWFRVLVGNCRTVTDGFIGDLLGDASIIALSRMQRTLPLNLIFPPAYSMFAFLLWRPFILSSSLGARDDIQQLYQSLLLALGDALRHLPFREVCLRDTHCLYDLIAADTVDTEFASFLESSGSDMRLRASAFLPLRARLFLNALLDCKLPPSIGQQEDVNRISVQGDLKVHYSEKAKLVHILDTLQPARFHWQWLEIRLLFNEQAVIEKLDRHDTSLVEALRSLSPNSDKAAASDNEGNLIEIILTRLLVRPDAAALFSEVVHLLGRSLQDAMLKQAKWYLEAHDVLSGRKSVHQKLFSVAVTKGLSTKPQYRRPWGWCAPDVSSLEEGEVVDEVMASKRSGRGSSGHFQDVDGFPVAHQHKTQRAFVELVLPCVDQASDDTRNRFAADMIKLINAIEQQINTVTREASKPAGADSPTTKVSSRKGSRVGSPGLTRRTTGPTETVPPSPVALRASISLRLQLILRVLPIICADGELSGRNMRYTLASAIMRLLGSRVVYADAGHCLNSTFSSKREADSFMEVSGTTSEVVMGGSLFDCLLLVLHALLSSHQPSWLKMKSSSKSASESSKDHTTFDREVAESLQNDLDQMQLPDVIRWRIQTAMPVLFPSVQCSISSQPPSVSPAALASLLPSNPIFVLQSGVTNSSQRNPTSLLRAATNSAGKTKQSPLPPPPQDQDLEFDPWILLEDGAGSSQSSSSSTIGGSDHSNLKAAGWLKGSVRVRRTDLTYVGAIDDDS